ncbi:MAG: hypothetical protein GYB65_00395, partial [Chloroflexi bacterium]|nr:hypothetical protein [Chloroflexota bacterium]
GSDPDLSSYVPGGAPGDDQDRIVRHVYDKLGRVTKTTDPAGLETFFVYDRLGRQVRTVENYVEQPGSDITEWVWNATAEVPRWEYSDTDTTPIDHGTANDQNLITDFVYNKAGELISLRDVRGTQTVFVYDGVGRQIQVIEGTGSKLETQSYTCYDKAGRVLRTITNWDGEGVPDDQDMNGNWTFVPADHGPQQDINLVREFVYDYAGRVVKTVDAAGYLSQVTYRGDGQVESTTDPLGSVARYGYDSLGRQQRIVQNYYSPQKLVAARSTGEIYSLNDDGSDVMQLTDQYNPDHSPQYAPDGHEVVFVSDRGSGDQLYIMAADGTNERLLVATAPGAANPRWSPDGSKIAYMVPSGSYQMLNVVNRDGSDEQTLYTNVLAFAWAPDNSERLAVLPGGGSAWTQPRIRNISGTVQEPLTYAPVPVTCTNVSWAPDGKHLVIRGSNYLYLVDMEAETKQTLSISGYMPVWSPDSSQIAYVDHEVTDDGLYTMDADGSNAQRLTDVYPGSATTDYLVWAPDGQRLFFLNPQGKLSVINADGSGETELSAMYFEPSVSIGARFARDPESWQWNDGSGQWEDVHGQPVLHGPDNDKNMVVTLEYDKAGRRVKLIDPLGRETAYEYDGRNRRTRLTNALDLEWAVSYSDHNGGLRTVVTDPQTFQTRRDYDRLGQLAAIDYLAEAPRQTPNVTFAYDVRGSLTQMVENDDVSDIRTTLYGYDNAQRLASVTTSEGVVGYGYDVGGLRTRLDMPGNRTVNYNYDDLGRLHSLTNWDGQPTRFVYDSMNRRTGVQRGNGLHTVAQYDPLGRLLALHHGDTQHALAQFDYQVDARGNRVQAHERLALPPVLSQTLDKDHANVSYDRGIWTDSGDFKRTTGFSASMTITFDGDDAALTYGTGPDHGLFDVYVNGGFWQTLDGYAAAPGEATVHLRLAKDTGNTLEIRSKVDQNAASSGHVVRFKQLTLWNTSYSEQTVAYAYDAAQRLTNATYYAGPEPVGEPIRSYADSFDLASNRTEATVFDGSTETLTEFEYNALNQISQTLSLIHISEPTRP